MTAHQTKTNIACIVHHETLRERERERIPAALPNDRIKQLEHFGRWV